MPSRILSVDFGGTSVNALLSLDGWDEAARAFAEEFAGVFGMAAVHTSLEKLMPHD